MSNCTPPLPWENQCNHLFGDQPYKTLQTVQVTPTVYSEGQQGRVSIAMSNCTPPLPWENQCTHLFGDQPYKTLQTVQVTPTVYSEGQQGRVSIVMSNCNPPLPSPGKNSVLICLVTNHIRHCKQCRSPPQFIQKDSRVGFQS